MVSEAMQAGPALDALVARVVFGHQVVWRRTFPTTDLRWHIVPTHEGDPEGYPGYADDETGEAMVPAYSTTGDGMLLVVERMLSLGWEPLMTRTMGHDAWAATFSAVASIYTYGKGKAADTLPHAVALAALAALEQRDG